MGTGLGLYSLCKRMEALKGSCGTRPRLDGKDGAEVWFCIPYRPDIVAENHDRANGETLDSKTLSSSSSYDNSGDESLQISIAGMSASSCFWCHVVFC